MLPRILDLGAFVTVDEVSFWTHRSEAFLAALRAGDYATTAIAPHPGVMTMWLGSAGIVLHEMLLRAGLFVDAGYVDWLVWMRGPVALVHALGVLGGYAMLRRLVSPATALLAALLWAFDPFVIGYSRVLHVDALAGTFVTLSVLAASIYWLRAPRQGWLWLSGICAGAAMLSKLPGMLIVPIIAAIALHAAWPARDRQWRPWLRMTLGPLLLWGCVAIATIVIGWPAVWAAPARVYELVRFGVVSEAGEPHALGNFFLGQSVAVPGLAFYPVALALRTTPWTLLGVLALPLVYWRCSADTRRMSAVLAGTAMLFVVALSASPKQFDRYLVPAFPALDMLAAIGLVGLVKLVLAVVRDARLNACASAVLLAGMCIGAGANAVNWHPYGIAAFNQVLGGTPAGTRALATGWGEGLEQAAAWLNQQPNITSVSVASTLVDPLQRYLRPGAQSYSPLPGEDFSEETGYVVVYLRQAQNGVVGAPFDRFFGRVTPIHVVMIHGAPYAWIYERPPTVPVARPAIFGTMLQLRGFAGDTTIQPGQPLRFKLFWLPHAVSRDYMLFVHLVRADGHVVAHSDLPYPAAFWRPNRFATTEVELTIPTDVPPGAYQLTIGLYDPASGARLSLATALPIDEALDGPDALHLMGVQVR